MKTNEFLQLLKENSDKSLLFMYAPGQLVAANYHITEVKHVKITSVDCGAGTDAWNETIVQLWESPSELGKTEFMSCYKASGILNKVGRLKEYDVSSELKIEYSNPLFHTAQLFVNQFEIRNNQLLFSLSVADTDCKAKEACGLPPSEISHHMPPTVSAVKQEKNNIIKTMACAPESGCC